MIKSINIVSRPMILSPNEVLYSLWQTGCNYAVVISGDGFAFFDGFIDLDLITLNAVFNNAIERINNQ